MRESRESTREMAAELDRHDPLAVCRDRFHLPEELLYFDGNSLGPLPKASREHLFQVVNRQWGEDLIGSWNSHDWIGLPRRVGRRIAPLIGAQPDQVVVCDSVSVNLFKLLAAATDLRPDRRTLLCQADHFPTDLYITQGLARLRGRGYRPAYVEADDLEAYLLDPELGNDVAVVSLGHVDFRTGRLLDMAGLTETIHRAGALALWDLSHSAGALPVRLDEHRVDFAVGCGYKFLNGGPGAPSFLYVAERHLQQTVNPLSGWFGHSDPFAFTRDYAPAAGIDRFVCGTPPILAMAALDAALDVWQGVDLQVLRAKSIGLGDLFLGLVAERCAGWGLSPACPARAELRGSQVCWTHAQGYGVMQALIERRLIGDFRAPDILRFGLCPLYQRYVDVWDAVEILRQVLESEAYRDPRFHRRSKVT